MGKRIISLFCCTFVLFQHLYGDNIVIADKESKAPLESATASVWQKGSDIPISLVSDDSGYIKTPDNVVKIIVKKFGYNTEEINDYALSEGDTIFLTMGYVLQEVSVSAIRNNFHIRPDRYIYDVASDSTLAGQSTLDALGRIPILNVTIDGSISSMQGKNLVYKVNGLTDPLLLSGDMQTALRSLKADYIKRIEMRDNPTGNDPNTLEINIITKGRLEGYQANTTTRINDYSWRASLWGLTKINKFCVSGSYSYMWNHDHDEKSSMEEVRETPEEQISLIKESTDKGYKAHFNNVEVSMSYDIDDHTVLCAFGSIFAKANPHKSSYSNTIIRSNNRSDLVAYNQSSITTFDDTEYSANIEFEKIYGENAEDGKLFIGYDFYKRPNDGFSKVRYDVDLCNDTSMLPTLEEYNRREFIDLTMHTVMAEYRRHFLRKHTIFANATYRFRSDVDSDSIGDNIDKMNLRQHLLDGSVAYRFAADKFSLHCGVGFRFYNDEIINTKFGPEYSYSRRNFIWQPTFAMSFVPNYKSRYELTYSHSSLVPDISVMNPFVFQDEPTRVSYGNPHISPEKNHQLVLTANYQFDKAYFSASLSGLYTSGVILQYFFWIIMS